MEYLLIFIMALATAGLTLYSGFGLGTLLLPAYALFFSPELAVMATALVHFANNIFKVSMVGKHAQKDVVLQFGIPAMFTAMLGAALLGYLSQGEVLLHYSFAGQEANITSLKLCLATFMFIFALVELLPRFKGLQFERKYIFWGGVLSGFFGGFSGHQGALRSAFLAKVNLEPKAFVGSNAVIGFMVDMTRLAVYGAALWMTEFSQLAQGADFVLVGIVGAFVGVFLGKKFLHKLTMRTVQRITGIMLLGISLALGAGFI